MKKLSILLILAFSLNCSFASFTLTEPKGKPKTEITKAQQDRAVMEMVAKMSVKDYEKLRGKKLSFAEKIGFKIIKKKFQKKLAAPDATSGFNVGGFFLGLLLGLIGVLIAYVASKDPNFRKWTWIGWGVWVVILLIILAGS